MERLNALGSSNALRRALFPNHFPGEVMMFVLETWQDFSLRHQVRLENNITALLRDALIETKVLQSRSWFISLEDPIIDPDFGTQLGRNDLRFYFLNDPSQRTFFTLECKRLRVRTDSGFNSLTGDYVKDGLQRFVKGNYCKGAPCGGMLGYVMDNCVDEAFESVKREIEKQKRALKMRKKKPVTVPSSVLSHHPHSLDTFHFRQDGDLIIHHLFVGVANNS